MGGSRKEGGNSLQWAHLAGLMLASLAAIAVLTVAVAGAGGGGGAPALGHLTVRHLVVLAVLAGAFGFIVLAVVILLRAARATRRFERQAADELARQRRQLAEAYAIIASRPIALIAWNHPERPEHAQVVVNRLEGAPTEPGALVDFASWLAPDGVRRLGERLEALFREGRYFREEVRTRAGGLLAAEGRRAAGMALLELRALERDGLARGAPTHGASSGALKDASGPEDTGGLVDSGALEDTGAHVDFSAHEDSSVLMDDVIASPELFDGLPMLVWSRGSDGRLVWVNAAYVESVGARSREEVIVRQLEVLEERQRNAIEAGLAHGALHRERFHLIVGSDGERRAFDVTTLSLGSRTVSLAVDLVATESAEIGLARELSAYGPILDRVATAVAVFGPDQRLVFYNAAFQKLWQLEGAWLDSGPRDGEILDRLRELSRLPPVADYKEWKRKLLELDRREDHEDWWHLPDGRALHVMVAHHPDGGVSYFFDDVSERLALQRGLNALLDVQRETLDHLQEGVAVFGPDGRLRLSNPAFARIWKLNPGELGEEHHIDDVIARCRVLHDEPRAWTRIKRAVTAIRDSRQRIEGQMNRPDGSVIAYGALALPDGATLLTFIDITDRKRAEAALIERNEALETADRMKSDFISHVSYELRTPLTNIIGFCELLASPRTGPLNSKQREYLGDIYASSKTLHTIINDILDLATIDAGTFELRLRPVAVRAIVEQAKKAIRERLLRTRTRLEVRFENETETIFVDDRRVAHVLYNLLSNAIGFSEPGSTVRLICREDDGMMAFQVEDEGCGIPPEDQSIVFERFESRARVGKHRGAGLGLAIVKSLVELHGGDVALASEPGKGTTVTVRFPIGAAAGDEGGRGEDGRGEGGPGKDDRSAGHHSASVGGMGGGDEKKAVAPHGRSTRRVGGPAPRGRRRERAG